MTELRAALITLILSLPLAACATAGGASRRDALPTGATAGDAPPSPFYRFDGASLGAPGTVLRSEPIPVQADMPHAGEAIRLLYTSRDLRWKSGELPVSGVLFLPKGTPPAGGWPLVSWGHGTLGISDACAPSWTGYRARDAVYLDKWLEQGFAVAASDYQGLGGPGPHPYHHWQSSGASVLDAARAALAHRRDAISNRVFLVGQSQGSGAVMGAAIQARAYAPDLDVRGVVASALTSDFPDGPIALPDRQSNTLFLEVAAGGLRPGAPSIDALVTPVGAQLLDAARTGCTRDIAARARKAGVSDLADAFSVPMDTLKGYRLRLKDMPSANIGIPVFLASGKADRTTTAHRQYAGAVALCRGGNRVIWRVYAGLGHDGALHGSFDDAHRFAKALLAGTTPAPSCTALSDPGEPDALDPTAPFNDD
ncbi:lipase [Sphingomonas suaedae]|uniref:Lipase n=1 Tax=Sphingomonas suaedae TaxID=2599297 RepID=A0A518RIT9_9SPHN|nr:lipase family protein [Sphingomonas suaedae]QDX27352.1 lipase [Sphingomonas suaedae]